MKNNVVKDKSFDFAIRIIRLYQKLKDEKREFVMSKQVLRSGTSVGAMVREAEYAESKADFQHKLGIAQKEINESIYWIELLYETEYLEHSEFLGYKDSAVEILKLLTAILKSSKANK